jgi:coenzyme F420 hydrogenase subunit beta
VEAAIRAGVLVAEPRPRDIIARAQPNLAATNGAVWGRRLAMRLAGLSAPRDRGQDLFQLWRRLPLRDRVSSVAGTWKRIVRERLWQPVRPAGNAE